MINLDLTIDGVTRRHPRGHLLIIDSTYDPEERRVELNVGCLLTMHSITEEIGTLSSHTVFPLTSENNFRDLTAAIASEGYFIWQKSDGTIEKRHFFGNDGLGSNKEPAEWVSIRDYTALASSPLGQGLVVPDTIYVTYSWAVENNEQEDRDEAGNVYDENFTESTYWLEHPANLKRVQTICTTNAGGIRNCRQVSINDAKRTFSVTKSENNRTVYGGPGGSTSEENSLTEGPAVELLGGYFAELYSWRLARADGVDDGIPLEGLQNVTQARNEKIYEYGPGGEVIRTVERQYKNVVGAMTQNDWRAGGAEDVLDFDPENPPAGVVRGFLTELPLDTMYLQAQITTEWEYFDDRTVETKTTLKSSAQCNGVGIYPPTGERILQNIDADNNGIETYQRRTSRGGLLNPDQPGRNPGGVSTRTSSAVYVEEDGLFYPTTAGEIKYRTTVPFTNPLDTEGQARERASFFAKNTRKMIEGDAAGVRVAETMRPSIFDYYPGMPFSFWDEAENVLLKLRMNGTSWAVNNEEAVFTSDGIFIGQSNGVVVPGNNVNTHLQSQPYLEPAVIDETRVTTGRDRADVVEYIALDIPIHIKSLTGNGDDGFGIVTNWDTPIEVIFPHNLGIKVSGEKVSGDAVLLEVDGFGSLPEGADGSLLTSTATVIIPDLFDDSLARQPDETFIVSTGAPSPNQIHDVTVFAKPADTIHDVTVGAAPPDQIFAVKAIKTWDVSAAELPFVVTVFAKPADQIFDVFSSAVPADQVFDVTRGPDLPNQILDVQTITKHDVTVSFAVADKVFFVELGPEPAPTPDVIHIVSVGGQDAPQPATPDEIFAVTEGSAFPDRLWRVKVITEHEVFTAEPPFMVSVGPETPDQIFEVVASADPATQTFDVTTFAVPANQVFEVLSIVEHEVEAFAAPESYIVGDSVAPDYLVTGHGFSLTSNPTIDLAVGQRVFFNIQTNSFDMVIDDTLTTGSSDPSSFNANVTNNGGSSGFVTAQFMTPGTYYYRSTTDTRVAGQILVTNSAAPAADVIFSVTVSAEAPDQIFAVEVSAEPADQVFSVEVAAAPVTYTVTNQIGDYIFNGAGFTNDLDPTLNLNVNQTYFFNVNASGHPFWIKDTPSTGAGNTSEAWADVLTNNGADIGTVAVQFNTPGTYSYNCEFHSSMVGQIIVT